MSGIHAAIDLSQMATLQERIDKRKEVYAIMCDELNERYYSGVCPHGMPLQFDSEYSRDQAMAVLTKAEIECRKLFSCIPYREPYYMHRKRQEEVFPVASQIADTCLYIPCHQGLTDSSIEHLIYTSKRLLGRVLSTNKGGSV